MSNQGYYQGGPQYPPQSYGPPQQGYGQPAYGGYPQQPVRHPLPLDPSAVADKTRTDAIPAGPSPAGHCEGEEGPRLPWHLSCSSLLLFRLRGRLRVLCRMLRGEPNSTLLGFKTAAANTTPVRRGVLLSAPCPIRPTASMRRSPNTRNSRLSLRPTRTVPSTRPDTTMIPDTRYNFWLG
ncbi:hypothetical protein BKA80DRAFT_343441 [Phyllosticta citrichinensis]